MPLYEPHIYLFLLFKNSVRNIFLICFSYTLEINLGLLHMFYIFLLVCHFHLILLMVDVVKIINFFFGGVLCIPRSYGFQSHKNSFQYFFLVVYSFIFLYLTQRTTWSLFGVHFKVLALFFFPYGWPILSAVKILFLPYNSRGYFYHKPNSSIFLGLILCSVWFIY